MNIPEKINAFIEETGEETTRLLATKFVADEAVGLVGELVAALTQLHTVSSTIFPPENEKVPLLWRMAIQQAAAALAKAAQFTAAITSTAPTVGGETETQIFPPVDAGNAEASAYISGKARAASERQHPNRRRRNRNPNFPARGCGGGI